MRRSSDKVTSSPINGRGPQSSKLDTRLYRVQVIDRAAQILDCFTFEQPELPVSEIAAKTGLHKSTAHRILMALEYNDIIGQNRETGNYYLGMKLFKLGNQAAARIQLREVAKPYLIQLMEETEETVHLAVLDEDQVLYLEKVEGPHALRMPSRVGRRIPTYCTSLGKAMLSCLEAEQVKDHLQGPPLKAYTRNTIKNVDALLKDLERIRLRGYAIDNEEIELGLRCAGAPIRDHSGRMVGAVSVAGPSARLNQEKLSFFGTKVLKVAASISRNLGYDTFERYKKVFSK
ncbi:MAG TPA: IclR family transcriptional regulator [Candidatus Binatia bacterium]|jgi:DNA-binding IclR family transcriptional regulator|nr:IclR family transcriptional regulator [Candidatus Binatia bacterium]